MVMIMCILLSGLSPVYIDTGEIKGYMKSVTYKGIYIIDRQACLPRQGESHPDTQRAFGLHIFMAHQSGPWLIGQTPEDLLVQHSLSSP